MDVESLEQLWECLCNLCDISTLFWWNLYKTYKSPNIRDWKGIWDYSWILLLKENIYEEIIIMLAVWFNAILILLESLYQVVLYIYKLSDRDKIWRGGEIGTYVIFTTVMFTNALKQIYFYKYKKSLKGEKFSKVLRSIIEIEICMYNLAFDIPIEKNSIYEVIKDTWVNIFGSMSVIILVLVCWLW